MSQKESIPFDTSSIEAIASLPFSRDNQVQLLQSGQTTFQTILDSLTSARDIICIEFYIFKDDDTGQRLAEVLKEKAREGVKVYVLYDHFGSLLTSRSFWKDLRRAGVHLKASHPFRWDAPLGYFYRNHKKLLIIDGKKAFLGGFNIANEYYGYFKKIRDIWRDTGIYLKGPIASTLLELFSKSWRTWQGEQIVLKQVSADFSGGVSVIPIFTISGRSRRKMRRLFLHSIRNATSSILITTAYFTPGRKTLKALERASRRGIRLKLLLPGKTDVKSVYYAGRAFYKRLLHAGAEIYDYQGTVLHAKSAVFDGCWSIIGSANLHYQSFSRNDESNVGVMDPGFGKALSDLFQQDLKKAVRVNPAEWSRRPFHQKLLERFFSIHLKKF